MILSDREIERAVLTKQILIEPTPGKSQYSSSSLDLILGDTFWEFKTMDELRSERLLDLGEELIVDLQTVNVRSLLERYGRKVVVARKGYYILPSKGFVIGHTREYVRLPANGKIAARVEGRSTLARLGVVVHLTAPTIHCGFAGDIALEMYNFGAHPILLRPGSLHVCQIIFERLGEVPRRTVPPTRYVGQRSGMSRRKIV